jgi:hypothetical protein
LLCAGAICHAQPVSPLPFVPASPLPEVEPVSNQFAVAVDGTGVPVFLARIAAMSAEKRLHLGLPVAAGTSLTSFTSFDVSKPATISVTCGEDVKSATLLPAGSGITAQISGRQVTFTISQPAQLTLEINGNWVNSLHLFANAPESDIPNLDDPNVIYFGPGVHVVQTVEAKSGQTIYLAPGAVLYGTPDAPGATVHKRAIILLDGNNVTLRGRGIIDGSQCPRGAKSLVAVFGTNIRIEGVTLRDAGDWNLPVRRSSQVQISNVKVFGWRGNSDGMDICNCSDVAITDCFLRTFDDLIVLKTDKGQGDEAGITVSRCVLWNEFAHALSLGAELREPVSDVTFSDCDIIHDKGREWLLRVYDCDSGFVKNVTFKNIRIAEARRLMSVWIGKAVWSKETERGHIQNVTFENIDAAGPERPDPMADLVGFDAQHLVDGVQFRNVRVAGRPLGLNDIRQNPFDRAVTVSP